MKILDVKALRDGLNLTQLQLAELLNISQGFISRVEKGIHTAPESWIDILKSKFGDKIDNYVNISNNITNNANFTQDIDITNNTITLNNNNLFEYLTLRDKIIKELLENKDNQINKLLSIIEQLSK